LVLYNSLINSFEFEQNQDELKNRNLVFIPRTQEKIQQLKQKEYEKNNAAQIRTEFIQRLKNKQLDLPNDSKYMGEIEAFALCKTDKSKTLQEANLKQTIESAHKLLIETGIWNITKNPFPTRFGFSFESAKEGLGAMPEEERFTVP
jgi:exoribonuclease-2